MKEMDTNLDAETKLWQEKLFRRSLRRTRKMERITKLVGHSGGLQCLEVSAGDGMISSHLRTLGGSWKTIATRQVAADSLTSTVNEKILQVEEGGLPFENNTFDRVVIVDALKEIAADNKFIRECHRVLKEDGWVVINENCRRPASLAALFRRMTGTSPVSRGQKRNGYTDPELYNILKDGFDVPETTHYSNGLLETASAIGEAVQKSLMPEPYWLAHPSGGQEQLYGYRKLYTLAGVAYPLLWLLDLFNFLPGHCLLVKSRRRPWRPRLQPKLIDGRSIAEAAINTKIGTAAPF